MLKIQICLNDTEHKFLEDETKRLQLKYGIKLSKTNFIKSLLRVHMIKMESVAQNETDSLRWKHLKEQNETPSR
jgi:hypothetical protein